MVFFLWKTIWENHKASSLIIMNLHLYKFRNPHYSRIHYSIPLNVHKIMSNFRWSEKITALHISKGTTHSTCCWEISRVCKKNIVSTMFIHAYITVALLISKKGNVKASGGSYETNTRLYFLLLESCLIALKTGAFHENITTAEWYFSGRKRKEISSWI